MGASFPPRTQVVDAPHELAEEFAGSRPPSDALELAEVRRALRARMLDRASAPLRLERYEIRRFLGAGGHGSVYEAFDPKLDRTVAIKILRSVGEAGGGEEKGRESKGGEPNHEKRLLTEARAIARTSDPRVVAVHDVAYAAVDFLASPRDEGPVAAVFMVMEYVEGRTLRQWLMEEHRPGEIRRIFLEAARGLIAAHRAGVVHGDFKPENVMITADGGVKVLDFGIARAAGIGSAASAFTGTAGYASPEQWLGEALDERSDQYSFCRALDEALHVTPTAHERTCAAGSAARAAPRRRARVGVPLALRRVVRRGLALSPRDRFASMEQLVSALEKAWAPAPSPLVPVLLGVLAVAAATTAGQGPLPATAFARCIGAAPGDIWNAARSVRLEKAFSETELAYANHSWQSVTRELESYAALFRTSVDAACSMAGEGRAGPVSSAALRCLDERRRTVGSLLDVMEERPRQVLPYAVDAVFSLRPPGTCLSARERPGIAPKPMPACAARVESELYALDAGITAAIFEDGVSRGAAVHAAALECAPERLGAWAGLVHGLELLNAAQYTAASTVLRAAFLEAEAAGDSRVAVRAMTAQILAYEKRGEMALVDRVIEDALARSSAGAEDWGPDLEASFLGEVSRVRRHQGRYAEAFDLARRAVQLRETHWGEHHPLTGRAKMRLADVYYKQRDFRNAEAMALGVLDDVLSYVGPHHPDAAGVYTLLGNIAWRRGSYESAEARFSDAERVWAELFGPRDPRALRAVEARAAVYVSAGRFLEAWTALEPLVMRPPQGADDSGARANRTIAAAEALIGMARYEEAARMLDFGMAELTREKGADHVDLGYPLLGLGRLELARGNPLQAEAHCRRAASIWRERLGERHPKLSWVYACLGRAALAKGAPQASTEALELALSLYDGDVDDPRNLAEIEFALARSLERDNPARALALAAESAELYLRMPTHRHQAAEVLLLQQRLATADGRRGSP